MRALPDARQIQLNEKRGGEALSKTLRPALNIPAGMRRATVSSGRYNTYHGADSQAVRPVFTTNFPYAESRSEIERIETRIKETVGSTAFQTFQILDSTGNHKMTIPEIQERKAEKLLSRVNATMRLDNQSREISSTIA